MLLQTKGLTKRFGGLIALNRVDVCINEGELLAIIGPNGSGKTTFFNVLTGFHPASGGRITFKGEDITRLKAYERTRRGIVRTFQTTRLFEDQTVLDNVIVAHRLRTKAGILDAIAMSRRLKQEESECENDAWRVLDFIGLSALAWSPVRSISQEARKRLAIGMALATKPSLLLLDEPTAGIGFEETAGICALIKKIRSSGITVCLVEHKMRMVMELADRVVVLNYGVKICEGPPSEVARNEDVIKAYLGSDGVA